MIRRDLNFIDHFGDDLSFRDFPWHNHLAFVLHFQLLIDKIQIM